MCMEPGFNAKIVDTPLNEQWYWLVYIYILVSLLWAETKQAEH